MADPVFRIEQERGRYAPHVRPINELVDDLRASADRGWMPYVAPWLLFSILHGLASVVLIWLTARCLRRART